MDPATEEQNRILEAARDEQRFALEIPAEDQEDDELDDDEDEEDDLDDDEDDEVDDEDDDEDLDDDVGTDEKGKETLRANGANAIGQMRMQAAQPAPDVGSDRVPSTDAEPEGSLDRVKSAPLGIQEIENLEDDAKGG